MQWPGPDPSSHGAATGTEWLELQPIPGVTSSRKPQSTKERGGLGSHPLCPASLCDLSKSLTLSGPTFLNWHMGPGQQDRPLGYYPHP